MNTMPEKLPIEVLHEQYPRIDLSYTSRVIAHYPETSLDVLERTAETARCLTAEFLEDILLVGHGASVVGTTQGLMGGTPEVHASLCCLVKLVRQEQGWIMELNGDTSHLTETEDTIRFN
jgi:broad specificity phosphatase PhoE